MTREDYFRFRTSSSGLPDDELMLLDLFFPGGRWGDASFYSENFQFHANLGFTHRMTDDAVKSLLAHWVESGWLVHEEEEDRHFLSLTPLGGTVWEQERLPVWKIFCQTLEWRLPGDSPLAYFIISSPESSTIRAYLRTATRCGLHEVKARSHRLWRHRKWRGIPWKRLSPVFEMRLLVRYDWADETPTHPDWTRYQQELHWWWNVSELVKLRLNGVAPWPGSGD